jgi:hypothetical protein
MLLNLCLDCCKHHPAISVEIEKEVTKIKPAMTDELLHDEPNIANQLNEGKYFLMKSTNQR